jgi:hypothetical protein
MEQYMGPGRTRKDRRCKNSFYPENGETILFPRSRTVLFPRPRRERSGVGKSVIV